MMALFLLVSISGNRVAFRASDVQSVIELENLTPAPNTPAFVAGLAALRSRPMTVIDCAVALGLQEAPQADGKAVVVEKGAFLFALSLDDVEDVVSADDNVEPIPSQMEAGWQRVAQGMIEIEGSMVLLADVEALLEGPKAEAA